MPSFLQVAFYVRIKGAYKYILTTFLLFLRYCMTLFELTFANPYSIQTMANIMELTHLEDADLSLTDKTQIIFIYLLNILVS